jgi:hypothetical protein
MMDGKPAKEDSGLDRVRGDEWTLAWIMTGIALFVSLIGWVVPVLSIGPRELTPLAVLLILPFFLVALWFGWGAVEVWLRLLRWGRAEARLEPVPPRVGEPLAVTLGYDRTPALPQDWLGVLICEQRTSQGRSRTLPLWRQEVRPVARGSTVRFVFTPPDHLPKARLSGESVIVWRLLVQSTEAYLDREFHLPVAEAVPTPDVGAEALLEEARLQRARGDDPAALRDRLSRTGIQLLLARDRGRIRLPAARHRGLAVVMSILALGFGAGGLLTLSSVVVRGGGERMGPWLMAVAFIGGSAAAFATSVYRFLDRRTVEWGDGRVRLTWSHLLGRGQVEVPLDRIRGLKPWVSYESGTREGPDPTKESIAIAAVTDDARLIPVADGIPSRWDAEGLLEVLAQLWNVPKEGLGNFDHPPGYRLGGKHVIWSRARSRVLGSGAAFATLLVLGALILRVDVGEFEGSARLTTPIAVRFGAAPPGTDVGSIQEARALAREAAEAPPFPPAVAGEVDLSGSWTLLLPAGFRSEARLLRVWTRDYELVSSGVLRGTYELREGDLVVTEPSDPRFAGLVWRVTGPDRIVLIEAPEGRVMGSDYTGALLTR